MENSQIIDNVLNLPTGESVDQKLVNFKTAAFESKMDIIKSFLDDSDNIGKIDFQDEYGYNALTYAALNGDIHIVKYLLERGADPNLQNNYGVTALIFACEKGFLEIVQYLLQNGANPELRTNKGWTALMLACEHGHLDIVINLVSLGKVQLDSQNGGVTALICATRKGHLEVVKYLLLVGADYELQDKNGRTALDISRENSFKTIAFLLEQTEILFQTNDRSG